VKKFLRPVALALAAALTLSTPAAAVPGDAMNIGAGTWTGTGGRQWIRFGEHLWRVLKVNVREGRKEALLLAEEPVAERPFDGGDNDWKTSDIRKWLNEDFYNGAFSESERAAILVTDYRYGGLNEGSDKTDSSKIFLLSYDDAGNEKYFAGRGDRVAYRNGDTADWWLRSPGWDADKAAIVDYNGVLDSNYPVNHRPAFTVRPALTVNLLSPIFTSVSSEYEVLYDLR
jgi:hypothetical protein